MVATPRPDLRAFPNSPYAAALQRGASGAFDSHIEAEYIRTHLANNRTLIRVASVFAALLAALRGADQILAGAYDRLQYVVFGFVLVSSMVLAAIALTRLFDRLYLPLAQIVVPVRNALAAFCVTQSAAGGQPESLMLLPLMVLGPFYFMGLRFRAAVLSVVATVVAFIVSAILFGLPATTTVHASLFLVLTAATCAIAARHLERWTRTSFLESHLIEELAQHDTLTGLKNRRVFDEHLEQLWRQAVEQSLTIGILMVDIDHFKAYNDRYGHQAGDQTLRRVAQTVQALVIRPDDLLARYGGEEFAVIVYDVEAREAESLAEQMRRAVGALGIEHHDSQSGSVTISVGVAVVTPSRDRRARGALQLADQALYEAKVRGRNRIEVMDDAAHRHLVTGVFSKKTLARK